MPLSSRSSFIATAAMATSVTALCYCLKPSKTEALNSHYSPSSPSGKKTYLFVGDIGGTNTRLAIYPVDDNTTSTKNINIREPLYSKEFLNEKYITTESKSGSSTKTKTFEHDIFLPFLSECNLKWERDIQLVACFAVAGPVRNNTAVMTNLGGEHSQPSEKAVDATRKRTEIVIDGNAIQSNQRGLLKYITKCKLVNDFVGQGYGLLDLDLEKEVVELLPGSAAMVDAAAAAGHCGPVACVGAGTGLGECFLTASSLRPGDGYECFPTEGGHVDFVPRDTLQVKLLEYLKEKFDAKYRVSVERVVSGRGLANVYEFLAKEYPGMVQEDLHREFEGAGALQGKVVGVNANSDDANSLCVRAMEIMMSAYGAEAGNCALKYIPTGGLYISGGLTPKNMKYILGEEGSTEDSPFMKAYKDKGRMSGLLETVPLFAVLVEDLGLRGARICAMREYSSMKDSL